ncbi:ABC transporter related protein [Thermobaculum terrenum ATCC BAA-798]|uniref:ABC transporter related protein n=1 Tax=Thermobaculum terrenum (strain ATCC BAA-798 / CCMEE 7001 / YNP1) TaxID=525904 RepID=D1CHS3_THET1|nr:ABC transporter ATP-binding protein [Thermobaculum terrenum]ACZ43294.1 ABC transporter related protein [Thermobaculum terrenum ATCC BAA-798]
MSYAIEVTHFSKRYGSRLVVDDLSFQVREGEFFALLGPNGAGKTTTIETLEGFRRPDSGEVRVLGLDPVRDKRQLYRRVGVMLQEGGLYPTAKPLDLLQLFYEFYPNAESPEEVAERLDLGGFLHTPIRRLSGGQRQRLSLALALMGRPSVLFLDEPTAGLDPHTRRSTWDMLRGLRSEGTTIMLTTHYIEEAEQLADRVAIIDRGRLVAVDTPGALMAGAKSRIACRTDRPVDLSRVRLPLEAGADGWYTAQVEATPEAVRVLAEDLALQGVLLLEMRAGSASLEEAFLELTGEEEAEL